MREILAFFFFLKKIDTEMVREFVNKGTGNSRCSVHCALILLYKTLSVS